MGRECGGASLQYHRRLHLLGSPGPDQATTATTSDGHGVPRPRETTDAQCDGRFRRVYDGRRCVFARHRHTCCRLCIWLGMEPKSAKVQVSVGVHQCLCSTRKLRISPLANVAPTTSLTSLLYSQPTNLPTSNDVAACQASSQSDLRRHGFQQPPPSQRPRGVSRREYTIPCLQSTWPGWHLQAGR